MCKKKKKKKSPREVILTAPFHHLNPPLPECFSFFFISAAVTKRAIERRVAPLLRSLWYWVHLGSVRSLHTPPAPIGFSPWLLGSFSGHAWRGRCIDLVVQMPSDAHQHNTDTHITSKCTNMARSHTIWILYIPTFYRFLCNFVFNETSAPCMLRWT